jgi:hypothetical protein
VLGNLANLSLFSAAIPGPEQFLGGRPLALVTLILVQIVTTLVLVGVFAIRKDQHIVHAISTDPSCRRRVDLRR